MKINSCLAFTSLFLCISSVNAAKYEFPKNTSPTTATSGETSQGSFNFKHITPELLYSYVDFDFDSTTNTSFNRYQGTSNIYSIGLDHINFFKDMMAGLYVLKVDTKVNSQISLNQGSTTIGNQNINNQTLFGHIKKPINTSFSVDVAAGYGQNQIDSLSILAFNTVGQGYAQSNYYNENWLANLTGIYNKQLGKVNARAYAGVLYSRINTGNYIIYLLGGAPQTALPLTTKTTFIVEGGELTYKLSPTLSPFVNAALIQVADYTNSRPVIGQPINGTLPQLIMDKNGYRIGGGLNYVQKQFTLRLEEKYYNAGNLFSSLQTVAALEYRFS